MCQLSSFELVPFRDRLCTILRLFGFWSKMNDLDVPFLRFFEHRVFHVVEEVIQKIKKAQNPGKGKDTHRSDAHLRKVRCDYQSMRLIPLGWEKRGPNILGVTGI